jgi:chemotaxis protein CheD
VAGQRIITVLGSCISITLWHPLRRLGTMSHFLLPSRKSAAVTVRDARFGDEALALMLAHLAAQGVDVDACEAKIFGGGNMFPEQFRDDAFAVGRRNGEAALRMLQAHGLRVVSHSLYGVGHRQIVFDIGTGDVWVRHVQPAAARPIGEAA